MKRSLLLICLIILCSSYSLHAQFPKAYGGAEWDRFFDLSTDGMGGFIVSGSFGSSEFELDNSNSLIRRGSSDGFLAQFNADGAVLNTIQIGADSSDAVYAHELVGNNLLVCGAFSETVDFDNGPNTESRTASSLFALFAARYTLDGDFISVATTLNGHSTGNRTRLKDCVDDGNGGTFLSGTFEGTIDFATEPNDPHSFTARGGFDNFLMKIDPQGSVEWVVTIGGEHNDEHAFANLVADGEGGVYLSSQIRGSNIELDPRGMGSSWSTGSSADGYIAQYDSLGQMVGGPQILGVLNGGWQFFKGLFDDGQGRLFAPATRTFDNAVFRVYDKANLDQLEESPLFVSDQNANGGRQGFGGGRLANGNYLGLMRYREGVICPITCDENSPDYIQTFPHSGDKHDVLIAYLERDLDYIRAVNLTSTGIVEPTPEIVELGNGDVIVAGWFEDVMEIRTSDDESLLADQLTSAGGRDAFIMKIEATGFLPVELVDFQARAVENNSINLSWSTASEKNNAGFEIQYSNSEEWLTDGTVAGVGNSEKETNYFYVIKNLEPGSYRVRLKQVDFDGKASYSDVIEVTIDIVSPFKISEVYPNPVTSIGRFTMAVASEQNVSVRLFDINGRVVKELPSRRMAAGSSEVIDLAGGELSPGSYILQITGENFVANRKVLFSGK